MVYYGMTYCNTLTDSQLENVLLIEYDRKERGGDSDLYYEAREECVRRDIAPQSLRLMLIHAQSTELIAGDN